MENKMWDVQFNITNDEYNRYVNALKNYEYVDLWGEVQVYLNAPIGGVMYGAELNLSCDSGNDCSAIYIMKLDTTSDNYSEFDQYSTDYNEFEPFNYNRIIIDGELIEQMKFFILDYISENVLKKKSGSIFINDAEKMFDFMMLSKDEFLMSYMYLTEEEYDATNAYFNILNEIRMLNGKEN